jgi:starvation-inducible DNA-binding protein
VFVGSLFSIINLMLDELRNQIWTAPNDIAERAPKIGGTPLRSVGQISRSLGILDNDAEYVTPLGESGKDACNTLRRTCCDPQGNMATSVGQRSGATIENRAK